MLKGLRQKILILVVSLAVISLAGSMMSVYRISEVNRSLDAINRVAVPMGRLVTQMETDAQVLKREMERRLGYSRWFDPRFRPRPMPFWIRDLIDNQFERLSSFVSDDSPWAEGEQKQVMRDWHSDLGIEYENLVRLANDLHRALVDNDENQAAQVYPRWVAALESWIRKIKWGSSQSERIVRSSFSLAEIQVSDLKLGMQVSLLVVVFLSLVLLWLGERTLRPLADLTRFIRRAAENGMSSEKRAKVPEELTRSTGELGQLAREFHRLSIAVDEREKIVEDQKRKLSDQNRLLNETVRLNENISNSLQSVLIAVDLQGRISHLNPVAKTWLGASRDKDLRGTPLFEFSRIQDMGDAIPPPENWESRFDQMVESIRVQPQLFDEKEYSGSLFALRDEEGSLFGLILMLEDTTEQSEIQKRLQLAENLAAVGKMSAQVAHEVRNPLHSIGLEAELAMEMAESGKGIRLKESLRSILTSVDRLEDITANYLRLSKPSLTEKASVDLSEVFSKTLATYSSQIQVLGIQVEWSNPRSSDQVVVEGDPTLLGQAVGNLLKNSIQVLESTRLKEAPRIDVSFGQFESGNVWMRIKDNGPGIPMTVKRNLFAPFVTTRSQGTGLGLAFVKKVLDDHGGKITLEDTDNGASFLVTLPALNSEKFVKETDNNEEEPRQPNPFG